MKLLHFAAFRAIMATGTVSGAAEILGRSQPAVSRLLDKLEYDLGLRLFERRRGLVTPTPEAHLLLEEVERAYASLEALRTFASRLASSEGSHLSLAVMPALGINFVPAVLAHYRAAWPHTKISLNVRMSVTIEESAAGQQVDLGIAESPFRRSGFHTEIFSDAPYVAAVPAQHPLADRSILAPEDLRNGPFVSWAAYASARHLVNQVLQSAKVDVEPAYETTFSATALELVKRGLGVAIIDPYTAVLQSDEQVKLIPFQPRIPFYVALLRPEARPASRALEAFLDAAIQERDHVLGQLPGKGV